jgi:predicted phosphodiesterase
MANRSFEWTKEHASPKTKEYLGVLPIEITITVHRRKVALFHASPRKNNLYWYEDRPEKFFQEMAGKIDADVLIYGHTHKPYMKVLNGKTFINAGSVGKPKDGDPRSCVALVEITPERVNVEFLRVSYDVEKAAAAIIASGLPEYFAKRLKEAR